MLFLRYELDLILEDLNRLDVVFGETPVRYKLYDIFDVAIDEDESVTIDLELFYWSSLLICLRLCQCMFSSTSFRARLIEEIEEFIDNVE